MLKVTINNGFDVAPYRLFRKCTETMHFMNNGRRIDPYAVGHGQTSGHPGIWFNHLRTGVLEPSRQEKNPS